MTIPTVLFLACDQDGSLGASFPTLSLPPFTPMAPFPIVSHDQSQEAETLANAVLIGIAGL